jgi:glycosyltransferase involved in cell wall biosynthesis
MSSQPEAPAPRRFCLVAPTPPPLYGVSVIVQHLLEKTPPVQLTWHHVNTVYASNLAGMTRFGWRKVALLIKYCLQLLTAICSGRARTVVITCGCYLGPFLKDSVFIWLAVLLRRRTLAWFHMDWENMRYGERPAWLRWFLRTTLLRLDRIVVLGQSLADAFPAEIPRQRFHILPNGIPDPQQQAGFTKTPGAPRAVLFIANIIDAKGWREFLAAARRLAPAFPEVRFHLHGAAHGLPAEQIHAEIARDNPNGQIAYLGSLEAEAKWTAYANAEVFVMSSHHEAFPLVILEAMGAALPIVATSVGAVADALEDEKGGFLVPKQDSEALAEKLRILLTNPILARKYAQHNREQFLAKYTLEAFIGQWGRF